MKRRRVASLICLAALLGGLFGSATREVLAQAPYQAYPLQGATSYGVNAGVDPRVGYRPSTPGVYGYPGAGNVAYDPRYAQQYGQRYAPAYYGGNYGTQYTSPSLIGTMPGVIGGAAGAIIGGHFGFLGVMLGGAVGYFLGRAAGRFLGVGNVYGNYTGYGTSPLRLLPGIAGAVLGAMVFSGMGAAGLLIGGAAGFFVAQGVSRLIFPQPTYVGTPLAPVNGLTGLYSDTEGAQAPDTSVSTPAGDATMTGAPAADLQELKALRDDAIRGYKASLESGSVDDKTAAHVRLQEANKAYQGAVRQLSH